MNCTVYLLIKCIFSFNVRVYVKKNNNTVDAKISSNPFEMRHFSLWKLTLENKLITEFKQGREKRRL